MTHSTAQQFELYNLPSQDEVITESNVQGHLCITKPWPGMARTIYGNHQSFMEVYYNPHPGNVA